jgi:hypothetical protein
MEFGQLVDHALEQPKTREKTDSTDPDRVDEETLRASL